MDVIINRGVIGKLLKCSKNIIIFNSNLCSYFQKMV